MKAKTLLGALFVLPVVAGVAYFGVQKALFDPKAPSAKYPRPGNAREAQLQDLDFMANDLALDRSYSPAARAAAKTVLEELKGRAGRLSDPEFELGIARISAFADNAHSNVLGLLRAGKYPRLPIRTYWFSDGFHVVRAYEGFENLLGARIVAADGKPMSEIESILRPYVGGPEEYFHAFPLSYLFEFPAFLHAAGVTKAADAVTLTLEYPDGRREDVVFEGAYEEAAGPTGYPYQMLSRDVLPGEKGWSNLLQKIETVDATLESARSFEIHRLSGSNAFYVRYWANEDVGKARISDFNRKVTSALGAAAPLDAIVLDVRNNRGGNSYSNRKVMLSLGTDLKPDGRLYIITGRDTFSAGMFAAAFAKRGAGARARIVGTRVGDRDLSWGEGNRFTLPNSVYPSEFGRAHLLLAGPPQHDGPMPGHWQVLLGRFFLL